MTFSSAPTVLLDLDGTLVDPAAGILSSFRHALRVMDHTPDPADDLLWVIGPALRESFGRVLGGKDQVEAAVAAYREVYGATGLFDAEVYAGIPQALADLRAKGSRLLVCTAKGHVFARRVVDHFGLAPFMSHVYGPELDGRLEDKGDLIAHILATERLSPESVVMVGDRKHDALAAGRHGIPTIGVLWGYGGAAELTAAGAAPLISAPEELPDACFAVRG